MAQIPAKLILSAREYQALQRLLGSRKNKPDTSGNPTTTLEAETTTNTTTSSNTRPADHNTAAFRAASRVFVTTTCSIELVEQLLTRLARRKSPEIARKRLVASKSRLALSLSSILFFHRLLFRFFTRLRLSLLNQRVSRIRTRYPRIYALLTSKLAPAIGASLSGLALGICPADQLRVTVTIYLASRALEVGFNLIDALGYISGKPWWIGSWLLFPLAQAQLFHAFVFDPDCLPTEYGNFILRFTPQYVQRRPKNLSSKVVWPTSREMVDSLAEMARLQWPTFVSPVLHPGSTKTLPPTINSVISPITSRAHPATQHLSCALLHPSDPSCFTAYLQHMLLSFPQIARFFTIYYGAFSLLRLREFARSPIHSLNGLSKQILKTTVALSGAIGMAWGSICLFAAIFPRSFLPRFRFVLGGLLGGVFQFFDRGSAGHANAMYAARMSVDSLWKVGKKHRWWRGIKGGDVYLFVAALAMLNVIRDSSHDTVVARDPAVSVINLLRGEVELGLSDSRKGVADLKGLEKAEKSE